MHKAVAVAMLPSGCGRHLGGVGVAGRLPSVVAQSCGWSHRGDDASLLVEEHDGAQAWSGGMGSEVTHGDRKQAKEEKIGGGWMD